MIEMMMTACVAILAMQYMGMFDGKKIRALKRDIELPAAVTPPKGETKRGIKFLPPVWEEESLEEMEGRVLNSLWAEGVQSWPKRNSPRWVYMPKLKAVPKPVAFTKETPRPVWLPELK